MASIAKASISNLLSDSDAQLIVSVNTGLASIAANEETFATPSPTLTSVQALLAAFIAALNEAEVGGPEQTSIKNTKRQELVEAYRLLAFYVTVTCNGNMDKLLSSGMPIAVNNRTPVGPLVAPNAPVLTLGPVTGALAARSVPVSGASVYNWRVALASAPAVYVQTTQTTAARTMFVGLNAGETYNVQLNAVGSAGTSDWSDNSSRIVI